MPKWGMDRFFYAKIACCIFCYELALDSGGRAMGSEHLQSRVDHIYDHLYANAGVKTPAAICAELGKILHSGLYWEESGRGKPAFDFSRQQVVALTAQEKRVCREVARQVRAMFAEMNTTWKLYGESASVLLDDLNIAFSVAHLSGIPLSDPKRDVLGDVIEIIRSNWAKRIGGQFFTDQRVTSLAMVLLEFDPRRGDDLVDICAGTGGFLLAGMNHIRGLLESSAPGRPVEEELTRLSKAAIRGVEVDAEIAGLANASLKARLGSSHESFVSAADSLNPQNLDGASLSASFGRHLCAASNPPFGTKITVKDPEILRTFDLAVSSPRSGDALLISGCGRMTPRPPDILFLEQNIKLLVPGRGRLAIVLPYQVLSGPQTLFVREWLLRQTRVLAVVDLPNETFQPHTGTKTALLVVKRRVEPLADPRDDSEGSVFMAMPKWIGHDRRGHPVFRRTADGGVSDTVLCDFDEIAESFSAYQRGSDPGGVYDQCYAVPYSRITSDPLLRCNALYHKPLPARVGVMLGISARGEEGWRTARVREVVKKIFYPGRFRRGYIDYRDGAVPFLGGSNITELIATTCKWLSPDDPKLEELKVRAGWLLVTRSGSTGIVSSVPPSWDGSAMSEHVIRIIPDPKKLDPHYLLAFLRTNHAQEIIKRGVFGSVIDEITPEFIGDIEIPIPQSRKAVAAIADKVRQAEGSRENSIQLHLDAVKELNELVTGLT